MTELLKAVWPYIAPMLGTAVGYLLRHYLSARTWAIVRQYAYAILADPNQTDDAKKAVAQALLTVQVDQVAKEAERVQEKFLMNGARKVPPLDIDISPE